MNVTDLRVEYLKNPLSVGVLQPRLSWKTATDASGWIQRAWEIRAANSPDTFGQEHGFLWQSGRVASDQSLHVPYAGPALTSGQRIWWQVRVWGSDGAVSPWSELAWWQMSLLQPADWTAQWIEPGHPEAPEGPHPPAYLRKEFSRSTPELPVKRATLHVTARGLYAFSINGKRISEDQLTPGWTSYEKRLQFQSYDVTAWVQDSRICLAAILADGWYRGPFTWQLKRNIYGHKTALLAQLHLEFVDGREQRMCTDASWHSHTGPIVHTEIYDGESYDARLEREGWSEPGVDDRSWFACTVRDYGFANLVSSCSEPVRVTEILHPVRLFRSPLGETLLDFGQNLVGRVRFTLRGKRGAILTIDHAEVLDAEGNFYTANLRQAKQRLQYTFRGSDEAETYCSHFSFMGFRYIRISDYPGEVEADAFVAEVLHSDMEATGEFSCSHSLVNQLQSNIRWGLRGNFVDVPTDCPQRDERMGWTGDAQVFAPTACFNVNAAPFFRKWLKDLAADQRADGSVPWVVPNVVENGGGTGWSDGFGSTAWADAAVTIPWQLYLRYGDTQVLEDQYASMQGWVEYMIRHAGDRCIFDHGFHFGDWLSFAEYMSYAYNAPDYGYAGAHTDKDLIATAYFYHSTDLLAQTASVLGREQDATRYAGLLPRIRDAFEREFVTDNGRLTSNTQTAYALALGFGILAEHHQPSATSRLVADIKHLGHLTTGFVGTPLLNPVLSRFGFHEQAYQLLFNERYPSWLYPITQGATTIWERWDGIKPDGSFQTVGMNSFNHYAYGAIGDWLYSHVAGLQPDPAQPGFKHFHVLPEISEKLSFVDLRYRSLYGDIGIRWEFEAEKQIFRLFVQVPPNTTATIHMPIAPKPGSAGNSQWLFTKDRERVHVGSGQHRFEQSPGQSGKSDSASNGILLDPTHSMGAPDQVPLLTQKTTYFKTKMLL